MEFHLPLHISPRILDLSQKIEAYSRQFNSKKSVISDSKNSQLKLIASFLSMERPKIKLTHLTKIASQTISKKSEIKQEIENAFTVYQHFKRWDPLSMRDFKKAHHVLMTGLDEKGGQWRKKQVVVKEGNKITHRPPMAQEVPALMQHLFRDIRNNKQLSWLIRACVFHYGVMHIHPFMNGNGRIGRIWQHLLMLKQGKLFEIIQISSIIRNNEASYYRALDRSDVQRDGGVFVEFCLKKILQALRRAE